MENHSHLRYLVVDELVAQDVGDEEKGFILGVFASRSGDVGVDTANGLESAYRYVKYDLGEYIGRKLKAGRGLTLGSSFMNNTYYGTTFDVSRSKDEDKVDSNVPEIQWIQWLILVTEVGLWKRCRSQR